MTWRNEINPIDNIDDVSILNEKYGIKSMLIDGVLLNLNGTPFENFPEDFETKKQELIDEYNLRDQFEDEEEWDAEEEMEKIMGDFNVEEKPKGSQVNTPEGREWLRGLLRDEKVKIVFTKKDGTERTMVCTLAESKIPSEKSPKNTGKTQSDEAIAVFDLEKQDWRSFRFDSVKNIEFTLGE